MRVAISGAMGKMGSACARVFREENCEIAFCVDARAVGDCYPAFSAVPQDRQADVLVDFSSPSALVPLLAFCRERRMAAVIATTGFSGTEQAELQAASGEIPLFVSRNMAVGVHWLGRVCKLLAGALAGAYDIEIVETHHAAKRDAPSGTALYLADIVGEAMGDAAFVYDRRGREGRHKNEVGIHAVRGGDVIGRHEVHFFGKGESITLSHRAEDRDLFARGAFAAARFLHGKPQGFYTMEDLLTEELQKTAR